MTVLGHAMAGLRATAGAAMSGCVLDESPWFTPAARSERARVT